MWGFSFSISFSAATVAIWLMRGECLGFDRKSSSICPMSGEDSRSPCLLVSSQGRERYFEGGSGSCSIIDFLFFLWFSLSLSVHDSSPCSFRRMKFHSTFDFFFWGLAFLALTATFLSNCSNYSWSNFICSVRNVTFCFWSLISLFCSLTFFSRLLTFLFKRKLWVTRLWMSSFFSSCSIKSFMFKAKTWLPGLALKLCSVPDV